MLGNFSSLPSLAGAGIPLIGGTNQGLSQNTVTLDAESLASMGLPGSPLSFPSNSFSLTGSSSSGLIQSRLARQQGAPNAGSIDQHDQSLVLQQLQKHPQSTDSNCQYLQEQVQQQQQEQQSQGQGQELGTAQQMQGHAMLGASISQLQNQQGIQSLASVKLEQQQLQSLQGLGPIKLEQQVQPLQGLASVKLEQQQQIESILRQQQIQSLQNLPSLKLEPHPIDQALHQQLSVPKLDVKPDELQQIQQSLLTSHLQRQEALQLQRQQSQYQVQLNVQRLLHQQQQQQQLLQTLPHHIQRNQLQQQQLQQQLQQQMVAPAKQLVYENGLCARRLMQYMFHQRQRPPDNNIGFWRKFVAEFFAPRAKKRWCVSLYGNSGRQPTGVFPQNVWHCEICGSRPGRGFETTVEVLPRLCKIKYDSGILDELLYVDLPREREYRLSSGLMVLEYTRAVQESIFEQLRVVRDGQLRITFTPELKILSWEFCAISHEELLPRRLLVPQVTQLAAVAQKYQNAVNQNQNGTSGLSVQELQNNCQMFVASARQLARTVDAPTVNDLGYTKRYVRCLQISEVVNSMKDLIDFSREHNMGPMDSLVNFPRRTANLGTRQNQMVQQHDHLGLQAAMLDHGLGQMSNMQQTSNINSSSMSNLSPNNSVGSLPSLLHQNSSTSLQSPLQTNVSASLASCIGPSPIATSMNTISNLHAVLSRQQSNNSLSGSPQLNSAVHILQSSSGQFMQANQQDESNTVHHLLQEIMTSQLKGSSLQQGASNVGGNIMMNTGMGSGMGNLLNNLGVTGLLGSNGSGNAEAGNSLLGGCKDGSGSKANLEGISSNLSNEMGLTASPAGGGCLRNSGNNTIVNSIGQANSLGERLEQGLAMQDPLQGVQQELGGSAMFSSLGASSFNDFGFNWKSP